MKNIAAVVSALALLAVALPVPASARVLNVPVRTQQQNQWCWAGCTQAILSYYGRTVAQTTIAQYGTQGRNIPNYGWGSGYIQGTYCRGNDMILNYFRAIKSNGRTYPLTQTTVTSETNAGRPFIITWQWDSGGGHFIVGRGISGSNLYYMDPWPNEGHQVANYWWVRRNVSNGHTWIQSLQLTTNPPTPPAATRAPLQLYAGDFTGNGKSNIAIYRPANGLWAVRNVTRVYYGQAGDIAVPADYNNDGRADIAIFRPSFAVWKFRDYYGPGNHAYSYFGKTGDIPVPGDYNNSGRINWAVYRPSTGLWASSCGLRVYHGRAGDVPVPGPYVSRSGRRGKTEIAIFRPSSGLWAIRNVTRFYFGRSGDIPVPGAYSTSSTAPWTAAIYRPSSGLWAIRGLTRVYHGRPGDIPVPADYAGDWGDEIAVFRPGSSVWRLRGYLPIYWGRSGDTPASR